MELSHVYIMSSHRNKRLAIGSTSNLIRRLREGQITEALPSLKQKLVYFESYLNRQDAKRREERLKKWHEAWTLRLIENFNPQWKDLSNKICTRAIMSCAPLEIKTKHPKQNRLPSPSAPLWRRVKNTFKIQQIKSQAQSLRTQATETENYLWYYLRGKQQGYEFKRQYPLEKFVVDFICFEKKLVIELDWGHHALFAQYDAQRTLWLNQQGFRVLKFWNHDVTDDITTVLREINKTLASPLFV